MERRIVRTAFGLALAVGAASSTARGDALYTVKDLGVAPTISNTSYNWGLNGPYPGANRTGSELLGISPSGDVSVRPSNKHYDPTATDLANIPIPGMGNRYFEPGMSDDGHYQAGTVFEYIGNGMNSQNAYMVHDGKAVSLGRPSGKFSYAAGMDANNSGQVAGAFGGVDESGSIQAFLYSPGGTMVGLGTLGGKESHGLGINNRGMVVGLSELADSAVMPFDTRAFVFDGHAMFNLNDLIPSDSGFLLTSATDINDAGQIAAYGLDATGYYHQILLTPQATPEPATLALLGLGMSAIAARRHRARSRRAG
ncbi:DUF3466 family protein [Tundrisphaera sp. TA3]|uniref:DUF3466 family protein n=1 Tax=Tundrisphaera sp. TA3 TaxID=3435775 RepID=UPI003EBB364D